MEQIVYERKSRALQRRASRLPSDRNIEATAEQLDRMNWTPELLHIPENFSRITRERILAEVQSTLALNDKETEKLFGKVTMPPSHVRLTQASLILSAAELLAGLRADNPEAWDTVNELYEDD